MKVYSPGPVRKRKLTAYELALRRIQGKLQNRKKSNTRLQLKTKKHATLKSHQTLINNKDENKNNIKIEEEDIINNVTSSDFEFLGGITPFTSSLTASTSSFASSTSYNDLSSMRNYYTSNTPLFKLKTILGKDLYESIYSEQKLRKSAPNLSFNLAKKYIIDVFEDFESWKFAEENEFESNIPKLFNYMRQPYLNEGDHAIVDRDTFTTRFSELTSNVFDGLDWQNIVIGGGIVLSSLANYKSLPELPFNENDIELFIYGGNYDEIVHRIYDVVMSNVNGHCEIVRTSTSISILFEYPYRHIHISLNHYNNILDILLNFEIDCCALLYDGENVFATERSKRSLTKRYNIVNHNLRTPIHEARLLKFATYGFCVMIPGLDRHLLDPEIHNKNPVELSGLSLLIYYEKKMMKKMTIQPENWIPKNQCFDNYCKDSFTFYRILEYELIGKSKINVEEFMPSNCLNIISKDCNNIFLPWGPQWPISKIRKHLSYRQNICKRRLGHNLYFSGWDNVFNEDVLLENVYLNGSRHFMGEVDELKNDEDWYRSAYVEENSDRDFSYWLCDAVYREDLEAVKKLIKKRKVMPSDMSFNGKFGKDPLSYSCLFGNYLIAELLIKKCVKLDVPDKNGLYPIHYATYSGNEKLVKMLIDNGCDINQKSRIQKLTPLHIAVYYHHTEILDLLLSYENINVNKKDYLKRTPLFLASAAGNMDAVKKLHQKSAIMNTTAMNDVKVSTIAAYCGHQEIKEYLLPHLNEVFFEPQLKKGNIPDKVNPFSVDMVGSEGSRFWIDKETRTSLLHYAIVHSDFHLVEFLTNLDRRTLRDISDELDELKRHIEGVSLNIPNIYDQYPIMIVRQLLNHIEVNSTKEEFSLDLLSQLKGFPTYEKYKAWNKMKTILDSSYKTEYRLYEPEVSFPENKSYLDKMRMVSEFVKKLLIQKEEEEKEYQKLEELRTRAPLKPKEESVEPRFTFVPETTKSDDTPVSPINTSSEKIIDQPESNPVTYFNNNTSGFIFKSPFESKEEKKMLDAMKKLADSNPVASLLSFITVIDLISNSFGSNKCDLIKLALKHDPKLLAIGLAHTEGEDIDLAVNLKEYINYFEMSNRSK